MEQITIGMNTYRTRFDCANTIRKVERIGYRYYLTPILPAPKVECINYPDYNSAGKGGGGGGTPPIVLDLNRNGITDVGELEALGALGAIQMVYFRNQRKAA